MTSRFATALIAILMFVLGRTTAPVPETAPTTTTIITTTTTELVTTTTVIEEPRTTVALTTTTQEPVLCPGLPHPAHHSPCPVSTTTTSSVPPSQPPGGCANALIGIHAVTLPAGFDIYCDASMTQGHAGLTYWIFNGVNHSGYVAINPSTGDHPGVGAHEACHAWDFVTKGASSESGADACAAAHGYPNPYAGS